MVLFNPVFSVVVFLLGLLIYMLSCPHFFLFQVVFIIACLPLRSSSFQIDFLSSCLSVKLSFCQVIFLSGCISSFPFLLCCLPFRQFSFRVLFPTGFLPGRLSSRQVVFLLGVFLSSDISVRLSSWYVLACLGMVWYG